VEIVSLNQVNVEISKLFVCVNLDLGLLLLTYNSTVGYWWHARLLRVLIELYRVVLCAVMLSGNALASINVVALRQTRLVPGWVTVCERVNHFGM